MLSLLLKETEIWVRATFDLSQCDCSDDWEVQMAEMGNNCVLWMNLALQGISSASTLGLLRFPIIFSGPHDIGTSPDSNQKVLS